MRKCGECGVPSDTSLTSQTGHLFTLGKPLFEMCCFHVGIAQMPLEAPCQTGNVFPHKSPLEHYDYHDYTPTSDTFKETCS